MNDTICIHVDLVVAHKKLITEKERLEDALKTLTSCEKDADVNNISQQNSETDVIDEFLSQIIH